MNQSYIAESFDRQAWLQDSVFKIWLGAYPAGSRKACCEVCNNTVQIIAQHVHFKGMLVAKSTQTSSNNLLSAPKCEQHKVLSHKDQTKKVCGG